MIEQLLMFRTYFEHLLMNPLLITVLIASFIISIVSFLLFKRTDNIKTKTLLLYSHIFFLFSPFIFGAFLWNCVMPAFHCMPKMIIFGLSGGSTVSLLVGFISIPYLYPWATNSRKMKSKDLNNFLRNQTKQLNIQQPELYSVEDVTPRAYSITNIKPSIFLSVGLCEILNKKEMQAVLLHELYHIKNKSSIWKFSINQIKMFSPLSSFSSFEKSIEKEERDADLFAVKVQGTKRFLESAKNKINKVSKN